MKEVRKKTRMGTVSLARQYAVWLLPPFLPTCEGNAKTEGIYTGSQRHPPQDSVRLSKWASP